MIRLALAIALVAASAGVAGAYPQFQLSTGAARCNQCHIAPAGGGVLSGYGRDEAADTISRGGDGAFMHGLFTPPAWLFLGGDLRFAALLDAPDQTETPRFDMFPMQADLYGAARWRSFWVSATVGSVGRAREGEAGQALAAFASREHWVMWRPAAQGPYVRAGRFFAPFGLRLVEHPVFVRRFLGQNLLEESYGLSGGVVKNGWELHATAFVPDPIRPVGLAERGGALLYERRLGERALAAAQARVGVNDVQARYTAGVYGKYWLDGPDVLLMAEADVTLQTIDAAERTNRQLTTYASGAWFPARGWMLALAVESHDRELGTPDVGVLAADAQVNWFPRAHLEVVLWGRVTNLDHEQLMLQVHYYL